MVVGTQMRQPAGVCDIWEYEGEVRHRSRTCVRQLNVLAPHGCCSERKRRSPSRGRGWGKGNVIALAKRMLSPVAVCLLPRVGRPQPVGIRRQPGALLKRKKKIREASMCERWNALSQSASAASLGLGEEEASCLGVKRNCD